MFETFSVLVNPFGKLYKNRTYLPVRQTTGNPILNDMRPENGITKYRAVTHLLYILSSRIYNAISVL